MSAPVLVRRRWLAPAALYVALIFFTSSRPHLHVPGPDFDLKDKLGHCMEYFALGWLMAMAIRPARARCRLVCVLWFVAIGSGIGAADELFQRTVAGRISSVTDWMADVIGLAAGATLAVVRGWTAHTDRNEE